VIDEAGNKILDGLAGLWSVNLGYNQERLVSAASDQMRKLPYYHSFWNQGHAPGYELAARLKEFIPFPVEKIMFTSGGSDANDTAIKLVWYYNNALGRPGKKKILARNKAYHGVTALSASCSGLPAIHKGFGGEDQLDLPLAGVIRLTCPHQYRFGGPAEAEDAFADRLAQEVEERIVAAGGAERVAAMIGEPLMGAGGVMPPPRGYWPKVQAVLRKYDVLLIADEVVSGFGRLGFDFGSQAYGMEPDIVTMAKAITSSYVPMGAVTLSPKVAAVVAEGSKDGLLGHGYTFGGHPVACAVALECLAIYRDDAVLANVRARTPELLGGLRDICRGSSLVGEIRGRGLIVAVELVADRGSRAALPAAEGMGGFFCDAARRHGLIVRAIGDVIALSPPLIISADGVSQILGMFGRALRDTEAEAAKRGLGTPSEAPLFDTQLQLEP